METGNQGSPERTLCVCFAMPETREPITLPEGYYLDNFRLLIDFVLQHHGDTLTMAEQRFREDFLQLPRDAQRLYVRLAGRVGPYFRSDKLHYSEINDLPDQAAHLVEKGFLANDPELGILDLLQLLNKDEVAALFRDDLQDIPRGSKAEWTARLYDQYDEETDALDRFHPQRSFQVYRVNHLDILQVYRLLFFGNLYQDLTEFVLLDLGLYRYADYSIDPTANPFRERHVLEQYFLLYDLYTRAWEIHETRTFKAYDELVVQIPVPFDHSRLIRLHGKLVNAIARDYERLERDVDALDLYATTAEAPSRERRVRILYRLGRSGEAATLCRRIARKPVNEAEREFSMRFLPRLDSNLPKPSRFKPVTEDLLVTDSGERVEIQARDALAAAGWDAHYVENLLFMALYGLVFWDEIFAPIDGAFFNAFQAGPADLFTPQFYQRRENMLERRLAWIRSGRFTSDWLQRQFTAKQGINTPFINWRHLNVDLLNQAVEIIQPDHLAIIFQRLSFDLRTNRSGFPDLVLFKPAEKTYRLVEVKGPGDRVQDNQRRWLRAFHENGIPYEVLNVTFTQ